MKLSMKQHARTAGLVVALLTFHASALTAQQTPGWTPGVTTAPPAGDSWSTQSTLEPPGGSSAVEQAREALSAEAAASGVMATAKLIEDGRELTNDLVWRVYKPNSAGGQDPDLISTHTGAPVRLKLDPGTYLINVSFGRSHLTRRVTVEAGPMRPETFVLNAGGLRLTAYAGEKVVSPDSVSFNIYEAEPDQSGERRLLMSKARPGTIIRLNAGIYYLVSTYGGLNASVETEVSVEAGKLSELAVAHAAARATFALVTRPGGEAVPATRWTVTTAEGDVVARSVGALPSHILAPGRYKVLAKNGGREFQQDFVLEDSQLTRVEVLSQ